MQYTRNKIKEKAEIQKKDQKGKNETTYLVIITNI